LLSRNRSSVVNYLNRSERQMQAFPRFGARSSRLRRRSTMSLDHLNRRRRRRTSTMRSARKYRLKTVKKRPRSDASGAAVENPQTVTGIGFSEVCGGAALPFATNGRLPHEHLISASGWSRIASARCVARDTLGTCRRPPKKFEKNPKKFPKIAPTDRNFEKSCRLGTGLGSWVRVSTTDHFAPTTLILVAY
jgi:hypothetical protein